MANFQYRHTFIDEEPVGVELSCSRSCPHLGQSHLSADELTSVVLLQMLISKHRNSLRSSTGRLMPSEFTIETDIWTRLWDRCIVAREANFQSLLQEQISELRLSLPWASTPYGLGQVDTRSQQATSLRNSQQVPCGWPGYDGGTPSALHVGDRRRASWKWFEWENPNSKEGASWSFSKSNLAAEAVWRLLGMVETSFCPTQLNYFPMRTEPVGCCYCGFCLIWNLQQHSNAMILFCRQVQHLCRIWSY